LVRLEQVLWDAFVDHARVAWLKATNLCALYPDKAGVFLKRYDNIWLQTDFFGTRSHLQMNWNLVLPKMGVFN